MRLNPRSRVPKSRKRRRGDGRPVRRRHQAGQLDQAASLAQSEPAAPPPAVPGVRRAHQFIGDGVRRQAEDEVVRLTNEFRVARGLSPLVPSELLRQAARDHSSEMAMRRFFGHVDALGRTPFDRMREHGYPLPAAENIAHGQLTPASAVEAWIRSPGHLANLLLPTAVSLGVGLHNYYWTQNFGY
ncbi:CAP domain-containing protein [Jatrophihabitans sp. GAS493]|uniref:CAP domain-containing protein n=1 Tax=Jatrophihabitans sp. GAS493 TaxID=1907575 RepID=UPI000BB79106